MKKYDFESIKRYIQMHSDLIDEVSVGMKEDWFWTAQIVYENDRFKINLDEEGLEIGGISGSQWATPCMRIKLKDNDDEIFKDAFTGDSSGQKPKWFSLGCLSQPVQDNIDLKTTPRLTSR